MARKTHIKEMKKRINKEGLVPHQLNEHPTMKGYDGKDKKLKKDV